MSPSRNRNLAVKFVIVAFVVGSADQTPVTLWRELFTRAASAEDGASKQLARRQAH